MWDSERTVGSTSKLKHAGCCLFQCESFYQKNQFSIIQTDDIGGYNDEVKDKWEEDDNGTNLTRFYGRTCWSGQGRFQVDPSLCKYRKKAKN